MEEFGTQYEAEVLQNKKRLDKCDLLCFVFDSSDVNSFSYVVNLRVSENEQMALNALCLHKHRPILQWKYPFFSYVWRVRPCNLHWIWIWY